MKLELTIRSFGQDGEEDGHHVLDMEMEDLPPEYQHLHDLVCEMLTEATTNVARLMPEKKQREIGRQALEALARFHYE